MTEFLGLPIEGDPDYRYLAPGPQLGAEEFRAHLDTLFSDEDVNGVVWLQFTPLSKAGKFGVRSIALGLWNAWDATADLEFTCDGTTMPAYGLKKLKWRPPILADTLKNISDGTFDSMLHAAFGDHCKVIALRDKFIVEPIEHK